MSNNQNTGNVKKSPFGFWAIKLFVVIFLALLGSKFLLTELEQAGYSAQTDLEKIANCIENGSQTLATLQMETFGHFRNQCAQPFKTEIDNSSAIAVEAKFEGNSPSRQVTLIMQNTDPEWVITDFDLTLILNREGFSWEPGEEGIDQPQFQTSFQNMWIEPGSSMQFSFEFEKPYDFQKFENQTKTPGLLFQVSVLRGISHEITIR